MIGDRGERFVVLAAALVHQEIIISAAAVAGVIAARGGTRLIDRAAAFLGVEELADAAVDFIALAAHQVFVAVAFAREAPFRRVVFQREMLGEAFDVALIQRDNRIRTAISRTVEAIVVSHLRRSAPRVRARAIIYNGLDDAACQSRRHSSHRNAILELGLGVRICSVTARLRSKPLALIGLLPI